MLQTINLAEFPLESADLFAELVGLLLKLKDFVLFEREIPSKTHNHGLFFIKDGFKAAANFSLVSLLGIFQGIILPVLTGYDVLELFNFFL